MTTTLGKRRAMFVMSMEVKRRAFGLGNFALAILKRQTLERK